MSTVSRKLAIHLGSTFIMLLKNGRFLEQKLRPFFRLLFPGVSIRLQKNETKRFICKLRLVTQLKGFFNAPAQLYLTGGRYVFQTELLNENSLWCSNFALFMFTENSHETWPFCAAVKIKSLQLKENIVFLRCFYGSYSFIHTEREKYACKEILRFWFFPLSFHSQWHHILAEGNPPQLIFPVESCCSNLFARGGVGLGGGGGIVGAGEIQRMTSTIPVSSFPLFLGDDATSKDMCYTFFPSLQLPS